ncbi:MAG: hypothetical protein M1838_005358 [Thelocarpon superellum]|nr:MAG: hypothetical protein M1838_005358 [Thelocarpon superellum]
MTHQTYAPPPRRTGTSETAADADGRPKPKPRALDQPKIDRALDLPPIRSISSTLSRTTSEPSNDTLSDAGIAPYHATDYPDSSRANRRRPCFRVGVQEIHAKHDTRLFCISGDYVCSAGHFSRAWDLRTGEQVMSLSHGDFAKVTSLAFKPALNLDDEGTALWLGTNDGDLLEVDILSQSVVFTKNGAHHHSEVIRIFRHAREMWTLDDEGRLHMWPPDESGTPNLRYSPHPFRVPKGHSFSILVRGQLWLATGKEIRIFQPGLNVDNQFQVLARPLCQPAAGDVTSGATLGTKVDQVLFGHTDGKVTIYSPEDYSCVGIVNVSLYRISALTGVGSYLWAGYNTGMIYVYDTSTTPWTVKKDWQAHNDPVVNIMIDPSSMWKLDRLQVGSLGADNFMRVWDGMLQDDWLESEMQENDVEYCQFREAQVLVMTWNAGASKPGTFKRDDVDNAFFQHLLQESEAPEILVFGFQELIDLEDKRLTAKSFFKGSKKADSSDQEHMSRAYREWRDFLSRCVEDFMPTHERYDLLHTSSMVGLFTCIFVKESERERIGNVSNSEVKCGMGGLHGNKGALIVRFTFDDSSLCFVNCHLAAGQTQTVHRNNDIAAIIEAASLPPERDPAVRVERYIGGGDGSMILDHEICILNGDLNYRIDTMSRDTVVNAVKANNLTKLLERDQLLLSRRKNPGFRLRAFKESPITFAPTYKYDVGMDRYDTSEKRRSPAWCDRVLYRGLGRIKPVDYRRLELRVSDHRPVVASFKVRIKTVSPAQRTVIWGRCQERFMVFKQRVAQEAHLDFLVRVCGFDVTEAKTLAKSLMKSRRG